MFPLSLSKQAGSSMGGGPEGYFKCNYLSILVQLLSKTRLL